MSDRLVRGMADVSILRCERAAEWRRFERLPEYLHRRHEAFVPTLPGSVTKWLGPRAAFARRHGEIIPFLALRSGRPVGRIAAIVNRSHNRHYGDATGFFGFFDCGDDHAAATALFGAAGEALAARGLTAMRGPYNPTINDDCGILTEGFEDRPTIGLTWNPPYYDRLVRACGLREWVASHGFNLPLHKLEAPPRLARIAKRVQARTRVRLRPMNMSRLTEELEIFHEVYNATLEGNHGFVPIAREDVFEAAAELRAIADPGTITIAEQDGVRAGFAMCLPNVNEFLASARRLPRSLRPLWVLALLRTRRPRRVRQVVYGVVPRFRDRGLHAWLTHEHFLDSKARYFDATLGWIQDNNTEILEVAEMLGGVHRHVWTIYEKALDGIEAGVGR